MLRFFEDLLIFGLDYFFISVDKSFLVTFPVKASLIVEFFGSFVSIVIVLIYAYFLTENR